MKVYEGKLVSENVKIGIVAARFNEFIVSKIYYIQCVHREKRKDRYMPITRIIR